MAFDKVKRRRVIRYKIRKKIIGTAERPRFAVFRSNKAIYAQLIDDSVGHTLCAVSSIKVNEGANKEEAAKSVGKAIAEKAKAAGIEKVVFDRAGYLYHGRVKALADGAREGGLIF